jgi:hypothetical protein
MENSALLKSPVPVDEVHEVHDFTL